MSETRAQKFGQQLRALRLREGYTMKSLSSLLGIDDSTLSKYETGDRQPPQNESFWLRVTGVPGFAAADIFSLLNAGLLVLTPSGRRLNGVLTSLDKPQERKTTTVWVNGVGRCVLDIVFPADWYGSETQESLTTILGESARLAMLAFRDSQVRGS